MENNSIRSHARVAAVKRYEQLEMEKDDDLTNLVELISRICDAPIASVTLIDDARQYFRVAKNFSSTSMDINFAICSYVIELNDILVIPDAQRDDRVTKNPLVVGEPFLRFYAGAPLRTADGMNIGSLCVLDQRPKELTEFQRSSLKILARQVMRIMEFNLSIKLIKEGLADLKIKQEEIERQHGALRSIARIQSHEVRGPVSSILGLMNLIKEDDYETSKSYLKMMESAVTDLDNKIHQIVHLTSS